MNYGNPNKDTYCHVITRDIIIVNRKVQAIEYYYFEDEEQFKRSDLYKKQ